MKNKILSSVLIFLLFLWVWVWIYYKKNLIWDELLQKLYIKNLSWNTDYSQDVPYKKNDEVELFLFLESLKDKSCKIDYSLIEKDFLIKKILIDDKEIKKEDLVDLNSWAWIKIIASAKQNWSLKTTDLKLDYSLNTTTNSWNTLKEVEVEKNKILFNLEKTSFNWSVNNLVLAYWSWLEQIQYIKIWELYFNLVEIDWKYYVWIDKNLLKDWNYNVSLILKNNEVLAYSKQISISNDTNSISVYNITPNKLKLDIDKNIVLQWVWFSKIMSIQLNNNTILDSSNFEVVSDNVLILKLPKNLWVWEYSLNIMWVDKIYEITNKNFSINN